MPVLCCVHQAVPYTGGGLIRCAGVVLSRLECSTPRTSKWVCLATHQPHIKAELSFHTRYSKAASSCEMNPVRPSLVTSDSA